MSTEEIFIEANRNYDLAVEEITNVIMENSERQLSGKIFSNKAITCFDMIIQYVMVYQSIIDGNIDERERNFISQLAETGDFLNYVNEKHNKNWSWNLLDNTSMDKIKEVLARTYDDFQEICNEFVSFFKDIDMEHSAKMLQAIYKNIYGVFKCLAVIDEEYEEIETDTGVKAFFNLFGNEFMKEKINKIL